MPESSLPPLPQGMRATIHHDGVEWKIGAGATILRWTFALLGPSVLAMGGGLATGLLPATLLGLAGLLVWALVVVQRGRTVRVRVTRRAVHVDDLVLPLDELEVVKLVEPPMPEGAWSLVLRAGESSVAVGEGKPREHLAWLQLAITEAVRLFRAREEVEGREYSFLRKAPEALEGLIERK